MDCNAELPPQDAGVGAWRFLALGTALEGLVLALPFSAGVFQNYYDTHPLYEKAAALPLIGLLASGLSYLLAPLVLGLASKLPGMRKYLLTFGLSCCIVASIGAALATRIALLVFTQGVLYGIGSCFVACTLETMCFEWFNKRRGMAIGILYAGDAITGTALPPLYGLLLDKYGQRSTLFAWAIALATLGGPLVLCLRSRGISCATKKLPDHEDDEKKYKVNPQSIQPFWRSTHFWLFTFSNGMQSLGNFFPVILLPAFAESIGIEKTFGNLSVSLVNLFTFPGLVFFGYLSDKTDPSVPLLVSTGFSTLTAFMLWGLAKSTPPLMVFSVVFGFVAGGYSALWNRFTSLVISAEDEPFTYNLVYGLFVAQRGLGYVLAGPLSMKLLSVRVDNWFYASEHYAAAILFVGATMAVSSTGFLAKFISRKGLEKRKVWSLESASESTVVNV